MLENDGAIVTDGGRTCASGMTFRLRDSQCGVGNGPTIAWTAHDDERSSLAIGH